MALIDENAPFDPNRHQDVVDAGLTPVPAAMTTQKSAEKPKTLSPEEITRLGALTLQHESSEAVDRLLAEQEAVYKDSTKEQLIEALLDRDRHLARQGREIASGRVGGRLLREFVRGVLSMADHAGIRAVGDATKGGQIEKVLEALGAEPADLRQLKLHGSTLGTDLDAAERAEKLADGRLKS